MKQLDLLRQNARNENEPSRWQLAVQHLCPAMKILLRDMGTGLFYVGPNQWSEDAGSAQDFESPDVALDRVSDANLGRVELVMHFEDAGFDVPVTIVSARAQ